MLICFCFNIYGFDKQNQVVSGLRSGDYENVKILLQEWENENPSDPDLMTGWFNYYLHRDAEEKLFEGYMHNGLYGAYSKTVYNEDDLKTAISYLDKALKKNPYRMDIYFGKIHSLLCAEKYSDASIAIAEFFKVYDKNKSNWYWTNNQSFKENNWDIEDTVIECFNDYCSMYDFYISNSHDAAKKALDEIIKRFPENVIFLNYLSIYYSSAKEYNKAIEILLSAYKIDPNDYIIIGNLAKDYEKIENYKEAENWYTIMSEIDSEEAKTYASQGLNRIKNK